MSSENAARARALGPNTLACGEDGIYLWPGTPLTERQGPAIRPREAQEIYRAVAVLHGTDANTPAFFSALSRAARLLSRGQAGKARDIIARIELPPARREGADLLAKFAKFNPNHYGPGPQGGQFAPSDGSGAGNGGKDEASAPARRVKTPLTYAQAAKLVRDNNLSRQNGSVIMAIAWQESSFDPNAKSQTSDASGLMGLEQIAIKDVLSKVPGFPAQPDVFDPATNVRLGSAYLQILVNRWGDLPTALKNYGPAPAYPNRILDAASALQQNPNDPMAVLRRTLHK